MEQADFEERFSNWRRWCLVRGLHQARAFSIEGGYRRMRRADDTPTGWGDWLVTPPQLIEPTINLPDAVAVNRAYIRLALLAPRQARIIKILTFRAHWRPKWQAQKLGINYRELDAVYDNAKLMLANQLDFVERLAHHARTVSAVKPRGCEV